MRPSLIAAILLGTTCLSAPAEASPQVGGFILGALGGAAAAGASAAFVAGVSAGAAFGASVLGGFVINTVVALGLSAISAALMPSPSVPKPSERMVSFAQPISYAEWVFGRTRKGGPLGFTGFAGGKRYYVPILAAHPIEGFVQHWLDERQVTLNSIPAGAGAASNIATTLASGYGRIDPFTGAAGQVANPGLVAAFPEWTTAHDFKGLAGATLWARRPKSEDFVSVYPQSREWAYAPVIDGNNQIYDPRDDSTGYSNNAALCMAYWIVNILGRQVDWDNVAAEADACDITVTNAADLTQPKWTINGVVSDADEFEQQRGQMAAACDAYMYERPDGKVGFRVGRWIAPDVTLTPEDFFSFEVTAGTWGQPDEIAPVYIEPTNAWRETPAGAWVEKVATIPVREEPQLFLVNSHIQAARVAKRIAKTKHAEWTLRGTIGLIGYEMLASRFFRVVHPEMGIDAFFEIGEMRREGPARFTLVANSVSPQDFDFDAATEEPLQPDYSGVTNDGTVPAPATLSGAAVAGGAIRFVWPDQDQAYTQEIRYRPAGESYWLSALTTTSTDILQITGLVDGETYEAQIRNRTSGAGVSDWAPEPAIEVVAVANLTPPSAITSFAVTGFGTHTITWDAPNDPNYFGTRIYRNTSGTSDFSGASLFHTEYGIRSSPDSHAVTDTSPFNYYWAEPINASGIAGPRSGPIFETGPDNPD